FRATEDVGHRLAAAAAGGEIGETCCSLRGQRPIREGEHGGFTETGRCRKQQARLARLETARAQRFCDSQAASSASCVSCSVWCSLASALISSSSSPSMMRSIL